MRPETSWRSANEDLPMTRRAMSRPASATRGGPPLELFRLHLAVAALELPRFRIPTEVVGIGFAPPAKLRELLPTLPDLLALFLDH